MSEHRKSNRDIAFPRAGGVAQTGSLLCRGLAIRRRRQRGDNPPTASRRHSRLPTCATKHRDMRRGCAQSHRHVAVSPSPWPSSPLRGRGSITRPTLGFDVHPTEPSVVSGRKLMEFNPPRPRARPRPRISPASLSFRGRGRGGERGRKQRSAFPAGQSA